MKRFFTLAIAAALAAGMSSIAWSQGGGGGGSGGSGGAGGAGGAGASSAGTSGTAGTAGAAGTAGTAGATNRSSAAGTAGIGANGTPGVGRGAAGTTTGRANANAGLNNAAARANTNATLRNNVGGVGASGNFTNSSISQTPFFTDPGVRRQLNMNGNQFNAMNSAYQNAYARYNQAVNSLPQNLTEQQRMQAIQQLQSQFNQDLSGTVNSTLTNPQMANRFNQLNRQFMNFNAFNDPSVQQQLNLTPDQLRQIRALSRDARQQLQTLRRGAGNDLSNVDQTQWGQMWQQYATQLNGVLTPQQQQSWTQLIGQPYVFPPNMVLGGTAAATTTDVNGNATAPVVDPTLPKYVPTGTNRTGVGTAAAGSGTVTPAGTGTTGTRQATTQGTTTQGTTQGTTSGGTVR